MDHGKCRAIGLSDISLNELKPIYEFARIRPAVVPVSGGKGVIGILQEDGDCVFSFCTIRSRGEARAAGRSRHFGYRGASWKNPAQVLLAWAVQRGTALFTTPRTAANARENFDISTPPEDALDEINRIQTRQRLNEVVKTGVPGFISQGDEHESETAVREVHHARGTNPHGPE